MPLSRYESQRFLKKVKIVYVCYDVGIRYHLLCREHPKISSAWLFAQWATNKENVLGALIAGVPAGRASAWNSDEFKSKDTNPDWTASSLESFDIGQPQWNPPVLNVPEIRDIVGQIIVDAIEGEDVEASAKTGYRGIKLFFEKPRIAGESVD